MAARMTNNFFMTILRLDIIEAWIRMLLSVDEVEDRDVRAYLDLAAEVFRAAESALAPAMRAMAMGLGP